MDVTFVMVKVKAEKKVCKVFEFFRQVKNEDKEACGLLIGTHSIDGQNIMIKRATKPGKKDIRKRYSYKIKSKHHTDELDRAFKESNSEEVYLGTWHSHPEKIPHPSWIDKKDWKKQYKKNSKLFDRMVFVIVGLEEVGYWLVDRKGIQKIKKGGGAVDE